MTVEKLLEHFKLNNDELRAHGILSEVGEDGLELTVSSYSSYDYLITATALFSSINNGFQRYYRGVSNCTHKLCCNLDVNGLSELEPQIIRSLYNKCPNEFLHCKSDFEVIAKMQHFGLTTRLLDFTKNPYVALWFACNNENNENSAVYLAYSNMLSDSRLLAFVSKLALYEERTINIKDLYLVFTVPEIKYYIEQVYGNPSSLIFAETPIIEQRQQNQQSIFAVCINPLKYITVDNSGDINRVLITENNFYNYIGLVERIPKTLGDAHFHFYRKKLETLRNPNQILKIIIVSNVKEQIIKELSYRGINREFIYPSVENYAHYVVNMYKES